MTITLTTIPDTTADWPNWLDRQLVGARLGDLVEELRVSGAAPESKSATLDQILTANQQQNVLTSGTSVFSTEQFRCLFGNPDALLQLQERVLEADREFWRSVPRADAVAFQSNRVFGSLNLQSTDSNQLATDTTDSTPTRSGHGMFWLVSTVAAALLAVTIWQNQANVGEHNGLANPALASMEVESAQQWFDAVADAGAEWEQHDELDKDELLASIKDVSDACQKLIDNPNSVLEDAERKWFVQKCQNWKTKLDDTYADLQSDSLSLEDARTQADGIMTKLVNVLKAGPSEEDLEALSA